ncbi:HpcH/HpaI aldolase/citrate lyase family protein [Morchella snyderi]|nr:HpcH/HpaI aldolase/citrate lyase family protein [Morchella snyderi]
MQSANRLRTTLKTGRGLSFGAWQMLPGTHLARSIARSGVDWVLVDTEHGNLDDAAMHEAVQAIAGCSVSPVVRIPACEGWMFKRALDAGAHGIMVPLISSADDARTAVKYSKFPPRGIRGFGSPFPMGAFGISSTVDYLEQANDNLVTIVQIETKEALENVDEIAAVDGIDVLYVGPFDLGNSIGHPITSDTFHPNLHAAIEKVYNAAAAAGKRAGIYCVDGDQAHMFSQKGFHMLSVSSDMGALGTYMSQSLRKAKGDAESVIQVSTGPYGSYN